MRAIQRSRSHFRRLLVGLTALAALGGCADRVTVADLRLAEVGPFVVTLSWTTDTPARFDVAYGEGLLLDRTVSEEQATTEHRVSLTGLKPSTRYSYRLAESESVGACRTAPNQQGAFDLVVLDTKSAACRADFEDVAALPDLVIATDACATGLAARPAALWVRRVPERGSDSFPFGNTLIVTTFDLANLDAPPAIDGRRLVVVMPALPATVPDPWREAVLVSPVEAAFAGNTTRWDADAPAWLEIDAFEIAWVDRSRAERQVIVAAPPETRKTCLFCDRLLEAGRYEESIAWYQEFIAGNVERHEVEDAVFAIARILDEKLFRYDDAITAYRDFLARYPESRRVTLAKFRMDYLMAHGDRGFEALERFERAKAQFTAEDPHPAIEEVEALLGNSPRTAVVPEAIYWLAHTLESVDTARATAQYEKLIAQFPEHEDTALAAMAVGDIEYRAKRYRRAIAAYERAGPLVPERYTVALAEKMRKSHRNVGREVARWSAWALLAGWLLATAWWRRWPRQRDLSAGVVTLAAYVLIGGVYFALRFDQARPVLPALAALAPAVSAVLVWNRALARGPARAWIVLLHAATASLAAAYLVMYGFHQLYVFGL